VWPFGQLPDVAGRMGVAVRAHAVIMRPIHRNMCGK
jgi:hypothetical protein